MWKLTMSGLCATTTYSLSLATSMGSPGRGEPIQGALMHAAEVCRKSASTSLSSNRLWVKAPSILGTSAPEFLSGFTPLAFPFNKNVSRKTAVCFLLGLSPLALPFNKKVFHRTVDYWFCSGVSPLSLSPPKGIPQGSGDS